MDIEIIERNVVKAVALMKRLEPVVAALEANGTLPPAVAADLAAGRNEIGTVVAEVRAFMDRYRPMLEAQMPAWEAYVENLGKRDQQTADPNVDPAKENPKPADPKPVDPAPADPTGP